MSSASRYAGAVAFDANAFNSFSVSDRTVSVDYKQIRDDSSKIFGNVTIPIALAVKFNTRGINAKPDDYIAFGPTEKYKVVDLLEKLKTQKGYVVVEGKKGVGRDSSKALVTPARMARAFASATTELIRKKKVSLPPELAVLAEKAKIPAEYGFLTSAYGMNDDELGKHGAAYVDFCTLFDAQIEKAYGKGWIDNTKAKDKRSHKDAAISYLEWRGLVVDASGSV